MPHDTGEFELRSFDESQTILISPRPDLGPGRSMLIAMVSVGKGRPNGHDNAKLLSQAAVMADLLRDMVQEPSDEYAYELHRRSLEILKKIDD